APNMYPLAEDVWLIERSGPCGQQASSNALIKKLQELLPELPDEIQNALSEVDLVHSELGALFLFPLLAYHANEFFSERGWHLRKYAIPLLALHSILVANALDISDDISFMSYVQPSWGPSRPSEGIVQEWNTLAEKPVDGSTSLAAIFGLWGGIGLGSGPSS